MSGRRWPIEPEIPATAILAMEADVRAEGHRLFAAGRAVQDHPLMALAEDLLAWAVTLERMAVTSPSYHEALGRRFEDHPLHGEAVDPRIPHRAQADLLAFLAIGDLVLNRVGRLWLRERRGDLPPEREGFAALLTECDKPDVPRTVQVATRRLQVSLRSARNRLLAHVRPDHARIAGWEPDQTPQITLVSTGDPAVVRAALEVLNAQLRDPLPEPILARTHDALDHLIGNPETLTAEELRALDTAMRTAGYVSLPFAQIVRDVLAVASGIDPRGDEARD